MTATVASTRAELVRLRHWPAVWVLLGVWLLLNLTFGYLFPYLSYRGGGGGFGGGDRSPAELLAQVLPAAFPDAAVRGMPMFGGAIMLTLGALAAGSGYGWGTWKTAFTAGPGRLPVLGGTLAALATVVVAVVAATFVVDLGVATALAAVEGQGMALPPAGDIARWFGGGVLILVMWMFAGVAVGTLTRSPALAVGLGAVWVLAVENLLRGTASLLSWLAPVTDVLPGTVAGSVAAALGARPVSAGGSPGVVSNLDGGPAFALAVAYLMVCAAVTVLVARRQDIG